LDTPINVFTNWVRSGKDEGMERNHSSSVKNMMDFATKEVNNYSFIDAGCGNGWVVRNIARNPSCKSAIGVDGSSDMIEKAKGLDTKSNYYCADLMDWKPEQKADLVHSMEVFYYFEKPELLIQHIYNKWIKSGGRLIMGIDFYKENIPSHSWPEDCSISIMKMFSEKEWVRFFKNAGFIDIKSWRHGKKDEWEGTLIVTGIR
jgi:trans-aconitate methyltransferase